MRVTDSSYGGGGGDGLFGDPRSWPPGFRFSPTDEELILYYLKRKMCRRRLKLNVVKETDVYKWDPEELPGQSILKSGDRQWYFFTPRDRRYPNGARSNRATRQGYWKATGKDRTITWNSRSVGVKKTLVFYRGRAPSGDRTDWVMHEYTMDENELQRCKNVQDYYALYKVFKKSGPGPKNGEQYGAPFREEDWADDEEVVENTTPLEVTQVHESGSVCVDNSLNNRCGPPVADLDESLAQFADMPEKNTLPNNEFGHVQQQNDAEEETQSTMMGPSLGETVYVDPISWYPHQKQCDVHGAEDKGRSTMMGPSLGDAISVGLASWYPDIEQCDAHGRFIATQPAASHLLYCEEPEVTSMSNSFEWDSHGNEGVNFLEIADLEGPQELGVSDMISAVENSLFEEGDDLLGSDLFFDSASFFQDMGNINQISISDSYIDSRGADLSNQTDYQMPTLSYDEDQVSDQLWTQNQRFNVSAPALFNQVVMTPPTSASVGIIHAGSSTNPGEERRHLDENENDINSWCTSAISAFLGSVPTRPALASENVLISRAFERMSSFGRVRIAATDSGAATGGGPVAERRASRNGGLLFFSVLGLVCAVLWMLIIGTTVKVLKNFLGRLLSS